MSKYDLLGKYLSVCGKEELTLNMKEIEIIIGDKLPYSAYNYSAWWAIMKLKVIHILKAGLMKAIIQEKLSQV